MFLLYQYLFLEKTLPFLSTGDWQWVQSRVVSSLQVLQAVTSSHKEMKTFLTHHIPLVNLYPEVNQAFFVCCNIFGLVIKLILRTKVTLKRQLIMTNNIVFKINGLEIGWGFLTQFSSAFLINWSNCLLKLLSMATIIWNIEDEWLNGLKLLTH